jgi:hypothetical protein
MAGARTTSRLAGNCSQADGKSPCSSAIPRELPMDDADVVPIVGRQLSSRASCKLRRAIAKSRASSCSLPTHGTASAGAAGSHRRAESVASP